MNIEDLTIGQARQIASLLGLAQAPETSHPLLGRYCIFRSLRGGVHSGVLVGIVQTGDTAYFQVDACRRLHYQKYNGFTLCSAAVEGLSAESHLSEPVDSYLLKASDREEVFPCSAKAEAQIRGIKTHVID